MHTNTAAGAIDDISVWTNRGASNQAKTLLANFTGQPAQQNGSSDGWLTYDGTAPNEWQWNETMGNNGPTALTEDFEEGFDLPMAISYLWVYLFIRWIFNCYCMRMFCIFALTRSSAW